MTKEDRIELLEAAEQQIADAVYKIETALQNTPFASHADAYIIPHLRTWIGEGNPHDKGTDGYIDDIREWDGIEKY